MPVGRNVRKMKLRQFEVEKIASLIRSLDPTVHVENGDQRGECTSREIIVNFPGEDDGLLIFGISSDFVENEQVQHIVLKTFNVGNKGGIFQTTSEKVAVLGARIAVNLYQDKQNH